MPDPQARTKEVYNRIAADWAREHDTPDYWQVEFDIFSRLLPQGNILDLGCGAGRDYPLFRDKGYGYTGIDYSTNLLREAKTRFPEGRFVEGDILYLAFENEFDGFWAAASLLHIPKVRMRQALGGIKRAVKPHAVGMIALKKGRGERTQEDGRFFAYWRKEEFENFLAKTGFRVRYFVERPVSERTTWLVFYVTL